MAATTFDVLLSLDSSGYVKQAKLVERANSGIGSNFDRTGRSVQSLGSHFSRLGTILAGLGLAHIARQSALLAAEFDRTLNQVVTLVGVTVEQVGAWRDEILEMSPVVGRGANELAKALYTVTSAGEDGADALDIVLNSAKASAIGLGDTEVVARAAVAAMQAYGKANLNSARAIDILVAAVREGNAEADEIAPTIGRVVGIAAQLKIPFEQIAAFVATFTRLGVGADEAVTALRGVLNSLLSPSKETTKALKALGTSTAELREKIENDGLAAALVDLVASVGDNDEALGHIIPNVRALAGVLGTAGSQGAAFVEIEREIGKAMGELTESAFEFIQGSPAQELAELKASAERLQIAFGDELVRSFVAAVAAEGDFADATDQARRAGRQLGDLVAVLVKLLGFLVDHISEVKAILLTLVAIKAANWATSLALSLHAVAKGATAASLGLRPLVGIIGLLAGAFVLANEKISAWADRLEQDTQRAIRSMNSFTAAMGKIVPAAEAALASGNADTVGQLLDQYRDRLAAVRDERESIRAEIAQLDGDRAKAEARLNRETLKGEQANRDRLKEYQKEVAGAATKVDNLRLKSNELNVEQGKLENGIGLLNDGLGNLKKKAVDAGGGTDKATDAASGLRAELEALKRRIGVWTSIRDELDEINALMGAWRIQVKDAGREWRIVNAAIELGINPVRELDDETRAFIEKLLDARDHWAGMQAMVRDTSDAVIDLVKNIGDMAEALEGEDGEGIDLGTINPALAEMELLARERWAAIWAAFDAAQTASGRRMLAQFGLTLEELQAQIHETFNAQIYRLQVEVALENVTSDLDAQLDAVLAPFTSDILNREDFTSRLDAELEALMTDLGEQFLDANESIGEGRDLWIEWGYAAADALAGVDEGLADLVGNLAFAADAWREYAKAVREENDAEARRAAAAAGSATAGVISGVISYTGIAGGGVSQYGGQQSGSYMSEGAQIGGMFGPVWAAVGAIIGGAIKKGADDMLVQVRNSVTGLEADIIEAEGGLADLAQEIAGAIDSFFGAVESSLGQSIEAEAAGFGLRVRNKMVEVTVNGLRSYFGDIETALAYAAEKILSTQSGAGLGAQVAGLFERLGSSVAPRGSVEQLGQAIELAQALDDFAASAGPVAAQLRVASAADEERLRIAKAYGFQIGEVLALENERLRLTGEEIRSSRLSLLGVSSRLGAVQAFVTASNDYNRALDAEVAAREAQIAAILGSEDAASDIVETHIAMANTATSAAAGLNQLEEGMDNADNAADSWGVTLADVAAQFDLTAEDLDALRDSLAGIPEAISAEEIAEAWRAAGAQQAMDLISLLRQVHGEQYMAAEERALQQQLYVLQLAASYQALLQLIAASNGLFSVSQAFLDNVEATLAGLADGTLTLGGGARGGGGRRQQRESAAASFREAAEEVAAALAGATTSQLDYARAVERLREQAEEGRIPLWELAHAIRDLAALELRDIAAPFAEIAQQAGETDLETTMRQARERLEEAFADALARAADNPEAYAEAVAAIQAGFAAEVAAVVEDALIGLGDRTRALAVETDETVASIAYLLANLDQLGITAAEVADAVLQGTLPGLLDLIAAQAERVGDEEMLADIEERRREMELAFARIQFEAMVAILTAAGAIDEALATLIDDARELFALPDAVEEEGDAETRTLAGLGTAIEGLRRRAEDWSDALAQLDEDLADGLITQRRYNEAIDAFGTEAALDFGASLFGFLDRYYQVEGQHMAQRQALADLQWASELAQLQVQFAMVQALGILSAETLAFVEDTLDWILTEGPPALDDLTRATTSFGQAAASTTSKLDEARQLLDELRGDYERLMGILDSLGDSDGIRGRLEDVVAQIAEAEQLTDKIVDLGASQMAALARSLGITVAELLDSLPTDAELAELQASAIGDILDDVLGEWEGGDTLRDKLNEGMSVFEELLDLADEYGLDILRIQAAQSAFLADFFTDLRSGVQALYDDLTTGPRSITPVFSQLQAAQAEFESLIAAALAGDLDAIDQADEAAEALLALAEQFFAGGAGYGSVVDLVTQMLGQILDITPDDILDEADFIPYQIQARDIIAAPISTDQILAALLGGSAGSTIQLGDEFGRITQAIEQSRASRDARLDAMIRQGAIQIGHGEAIVSALRTPGRVA